MVIDELADSHGQIASQYTKNIEEKLEEMNTQFTQYSYLFDKNLSATEKLVQYINQEENSTIWTAESLTKFIKELKNI